MVLIIMKISVSIVSFSLNDWKTVLPVAYFPESAYWVAFDNSVPTYLPMYIRSRWLDMFEIKTQSEENGHATLTDHTLFSSGWELGYWQNDVATLRMNWSIPETYLSVFKDLFGTIKMEINCQKPCLSSLNVKSGDD